MPRLAVDRLVRVITRIHDISAAEIYLPVKLIMDILVDNTAYHVVDDSLEPRYFQCDTGHLSHTTFSLSLCHRIEKFCHKIRFKLHIIVK